MTDDDVTTLAECMKLTWDVSFRDLRLCEIEGLIKTVLVPHLAKRGLTITRTPAEPATHGFGGNHERRLSAIERRIDAFEKPKAPLGGAGSGLHTFTVGAGGTAGTSYEAAGGGGGGSSIPTPPPSRVGAFFSDGDNIWACRRDLGDVGEFCFYEGKRKYKGGETRYEWDFKYLTEVTPKTTTEWVEVDPR